MVWKFMSVLLASYQLSSFVSASNKLLNAEADTYTNRIWSGYSIDKTMMQERLPHLTPKHLSGIILGQDKDFNELITCYQRQIQDIKLSEDLSHKEKFISFMKTCETLFENNKDQRVKTTIYSLFDKTAKKYLDDLKNRQTIENRKESKAIKNESSVTFDKYHFDIFSTDK